MTGPDFYATRMGHAFFERDVPELVKQLALLNKNVEALTEAIANTRVVTNGDPGEADPEPQTDP